MSEDKIDYCSMCKKNKLVGYGHKRKCKNRTSDEITDCKNFVYSGVLTEDFLGIEYKEITKITGVIFNDE